MQSHPPQRRGKGYLRNKKTQAEAGLNARAIALAKRGISN